METRRPAPRRAVATVVPRVLYLTVGWVCVGLGAIGVVLPGVPTTPFLLVALWAFSRSSERLANWLRGHRRFGPLLRDWEAGQVIPRWAKIASSTIMAASFAYLAWGRETSWPILLVVGAVMVLGAAYVWSKPSRSRPRDLDDVVG